jgi:uncharacterized protein YjiS (DUF1127 family)
MLIWHNCVLRSLENIWAENVTHRGDDLAGKFRGGVRAMTKFPLRMLMRFQKWSEVHLILWRPAHLELESETDEQLKDIGLEPRNAQIEHHVLELSWPFARH